MLFFEIGGEARDRVARLDPDLVRRRERARKGPCPQPRVTIGDLGRLEDSAVPAHVGLAELLEYGARFRPSRHGQEPVLQDRDAGLGRDLGPDVPRPHGPSPALTRLLARDRDEAEVADRRTVGLGVAVDHDDALAAPCRRQGVGQAADAGPDDREVEGPRRHARSSVNWPSRERNRVKARSSCRCRHVIMRSSPSSRRRGRRGRRPG